MCFLSRKKKRENVFEQQLHAAGYFLVAVERKAQTTHRKIRQIQGFQTC